MLRWFLVLAGVPGSIVAGSFVADAIAGWTGLWDLYVLAVVLPITGLAVAAAAAPSHKRQVGAAYTALGLALAYEFACPAFFPEGHPRAYQITYVPFALVVGTTAASWFALWAATRPRSP